MPLSDQIAVTPEAITTKNFEITQAVKTSTTATFTATGHTFAVGDVVLITGINPDEYNGSFAVTSIATNTFTVANSANLTLISADGAFAFWASASDFEYNAFSANFQADANDVATLISGANASAKAAYDTAVLAQADATTAIANASTAQTSASTAIANALTAQNAAVASQSSATTAYNTAVNSLQASAYAIQNPSTKQLTSIDATGVTVFSGASASSGARVVLNSSGLAGYNSGGSATFSISASSGAAVFSGSVTGATITGGTLNIAGKTIIDSAGVLTANDVVLTGSITATTGTFTGTVIASTGTFTGTVIATTGVFTGTVYASAGTFTGTVTSSNATITGGSFTVGAAFQISNSGFLTATGAQIGPWYFGSGYISSSSGGGGNYWSASTGALSTTNLYITGASGTTIAMSGGNLSTGGGNVTAGAGTISASTGTVTGATLTSTGALNVSGASTLSGGLSVTGTATISSTLRTNGNIEAGSMASLSATGVVWSSANGRFYLTTSTERHKNNILPIISADYLTKILQLQPVTFNYKSEFTDNPNQIISGLIAERVAEIPEFSTVINTDQDGLPESIAYDRLVVFMIPALKQLNDRLKVLESN